MPSATDDDDWARAVVATDVLQSGSLLSKAFRARVADEPELAKQGVTDRLSALTKEAAPVHGTFVGDDLERIRLLVFFKEASAVKKAFDAAMPSAVLREQALAITTTTAQVHRVSNFQKRYYMEKHLEIVKKCLAGSTPSAIDARDATSYAISAHAPTELPEKLFSLASGRLQIEMLQSFRLLNPTFFQKGMRILVRTLLDGPPLALRTITPKTAEAAILDDLSALARSTMDGSCSDDTEAALALLCALGAASGRVRYLLSVAMGLLTWTPTTFPSAAFAADVDAIISRLEAHSLAFPIGLVSTQSVMRRFQAPGEHATALATDGTYLYMWCGDLVKVGSGYHGSVVGHVYATSDAWSTYVGADAVVQRAQLVFVQAALLVALDVEEPDGTARSVHLTVEPDTMCIEAAAIDRGTATLCTDGVHLFAVELHEKAVAVHALFCTGSDWARASLPVLVPTTSMSADAQAFWTSPEPFMCITNGHSVAAYRVDETRLRCSAIDLGTIQATGTVAVSADCPVSAITLDLRNNILWAATGKSIMCHRNDGPRVGMPQTIDKDDVSTLLATTESASISVLVRLFGASNRAVDAYWSDDSSPSTALLDVAFAVDLCPSTFNDLIALVEKLASRPDLAPWQAFVVEVSLKLLSINAAQWSDAPGSTPDHDAIRDVVQRSGLRDVLATLLQRESTLPRLRDAARRLYVVSIDILYPSVDAQWDLLANYVATNDVITLPLVQRMTSRSKMQALVAGEISSALRSSITQIIDASVAMTLAQLDGDTASERVDLGAALVGLVSTLLDAVTATCDRHLLAAAHVIGVVLTACDALCVRVATAPTAAFLQILESSVLGTVAPKLFASVEYLAASLPAATPGLSDVVTDFVPLAVAVLERMQPLFRAVERRDTFVEAKHRGSTAVVFESEHEYRNDMHEVKELRLDGAQSMTITFDSRCRSEYNYDYVVFYTDKSCTTFYGEDKYSGRDGSFNWPGVGNLPPLVIPADHCFVLFHSDGSNTDWGYKFTATADVTENNRSFEMHWLTSLEQCLLDALHSIVTLEATWCPVAPSETALHRVLESDLLHGGMSARPTDNNDDGVVQFLHQLIDAADDDDNTPSAARVAHILKAKTPQDQGTVPHINRAVRAVAAAILHHNMWSVDAYALGQGLRSDASPSLLRAWKNAQKMRNWFDIGDAQRPLQPMPTSTPTLQRQPSAFAGASEAALRTLCANVEARARFLLALGPASFSLAAATDPNAATKRWQLLAKYGVALQKSEDPASIVAKWHTLVDEVEAATQLQQLMLYRKSSAGRTDGRHAKTMTELVLEFVQSDVDVVALRATIEMRNQRASLRRRSLDIVATAMAATTNTRLCHVLLSRWASSLRGPDQRHVHVLDHLAGCGADVRSAVEEAYAALLVPLQRLLSCDDPLVQLSALQCLAQDFAFRDGDMLVASRVVPTVFSLLQAPTPNVRAAAQAVVRILLERFVQIDKRGDIQAHIAACVADYTMALTTVPSCRYLPSHAPGQSVVTPTPVPNVGFWMYIPEMPSVRLREGDIVKHGPQWRDAAPDNAVVGVVTSIFNDVNVAVRWLPRVGVKEVHGCHVYDVGAKTFEIVPLHLDASGQIMLKAHVLGDSWLHRLLGLSLTQTYHLDVALADGTSSAVHVQTPAPLMLGTWHHVGVAATSTESTYALYVDGAPVLPLPLSLHLQNQVRNEARLVESMHPSVVKGWQYFTVDIDGASALRVAFDVQTTTGDDDDACFLAFYRDDSHTSTWGDARYTSKNNLPGVDGNSLLDIAAGTFVLGYYTSEASADLWGFRLWVYDADVSVRALPVSRLYVGEPPGRIGAEKAAGCYVHDLDIAWRPPPTPEAVSIARSTLPDPTTTTLHDAPWHVLGCVLATLHGSSDVAHQVLTPATFRRLLECAFAPAHPVELRCAAAYVAAQSLVLHPRSGVASALQQEYVDRAMQFLIVDANPWAPPGGVTMAPAHASLVGTAYATFLRAASTHPNVASSIETKVKSSLRLDYGVGSALAAAWILGGDYDRAHVGTRIKTLDKRDNPEGAIEGGYIVSIDVVGDERVARVLFDLDPTRIESLRLDVLHLDPTPPAYVDVAQRLVSSCAPEILGAIEAATQSVSPGMMDVRARLLKVLGRLCEAPATVASLLPPLLCLAKATTSGSPIAVKPACKVLESTHPYKDSIDVYETVSFPGATSCRITFDAVSRTEKDCDYVTFYKDNDKRDEFWGLERYSGRDDTLCFPGVGDEAPLVIPASHFTYYWHTDSSNNDWGWRFTVQAIFEPVAPSSLTIPQLNQRLCHLSEMLLELPPHADTYDDAVTLTAVPSTVAPNVHCDMEIPAVYFGESSCNGWVVVAGKDVDVLTDQNATSITGSLRHGTAVQVFDVSGEWVRIAALDDANVAGWIPRHVNNERTLAQPTPYAPLEHGHAFIGATESNEAPVPPELDAGDTVRAVESHFDVSTIYAVETRRPHDLVRDLLESLGVQYARACLHAYVVSERTDTLTVDIVLGLADLVVNSESPSPTSALSTLVQRLVAADGAFGDAVAVACTNAIARDLAALPKQPRVHRVESLLPNYHERICFPGASTIRIEFDAATHCPRDDGVVFIGRDGALPEGPYHGSADGDNWPGVGNKPPLLVASDTIHAFFRSDDESSEALIAFTAYDDAAGATTTEGVDALLASLRLHTWVLLQVGCAHLPNMTQLLDATCQLYQAAPVRLQLQVLELWSTWLQGDATQVFKQLAPMHVHRFLAFLKTKLWARHKLEEAHTTKSLLLRRLFQCVVDADEHLELYLLSLAVGPSAAWAPTTDVVLTDDGTRVQKAAAGSAPVIVRSATGATAGLHVWDLLVVSAQAHVVVGLVTDIGGPTLLHACPVDAVVLRANDVMSVELDLERREVRYLRSGALVCARHIVAGPMYYPAVELVDAEDTVALQTSQPLQWLRTVQAINPPWYQRAVASLGLLECFHRRTDVPSHFYTETPESIVLAKVVRGADWAYGNEDGGVGNFGIVITKEPWRGQPDAAVRVQWLHDKSTGLYRFGYRGLYDVLPAVVFPLLTQPSTDVASGFVALDGPVHVTIPNLPSMHGDWTIQLWLRRDGSFAETQVLLHVATDANWWLRLAIDSKRRLQLIVYAGQRQQITCPRVLALDVWSRVDICAFGSAIAFHVNGDIVHHDRLHAKLQCMPATSTTLHLGASDEDGTKPWRGQLSHVRLWDAPMYMQQYYADVLKRQYNSVDVGEPATFEQLAMVAAAAPNEFSDGTRALLKSYRAFTYVNRHSDFASLRPQGVGVLAPNCAYGKVYYELTLLRCTCLQLGWSFGGCAISSRDMGIGDCNRSFGVDLCRQAMWNEEKTTISEAIWQPGDIFGCLLDWHAGIMTFSLNGRVLANVFFQCNSETTTPMSPKDGMASSQWSRDDDDDGDSGDDEVSSAGDQENDDSDNHSSCSSKGSDAENAPTDAGTPPLESSAIPETATAKATPDNSATDDQHPGSAWLGHGGIFPSGSFLTGDGAIWNLGQRPFHHLPNGYVSVLEAAGVPCNATVQFEIFDFEENSWQPVAYRHGVHDVAPRLVGAWMSVAGTECTVPDTSRFEQHGATLSTPSWSTSGPPVPIPRPRTSCSARFQSSSVVMSAAHAKENEELVRYINDVCGARSLTSEALFALSWVDVAPAETAFVRWPLLAKLHDVPSTEPTSLSARFALLVALNKVILGLLQYVDLVVDDGPRTLVSRLTAARGLLFHVLKRELWDVQVTATSVSSTERPLTLNRPKATRGRLGSNGTNPFALFAQAYRVLGLWDATCYRSTGNLYKVTFLGENAVDGGGPYRETFTEFCAELQSPQLPLLLPTSNGQHNVGHCRDAYVLHPQAHVQHSSMLVFLGKLLGVAIRTKDCLSLTLSQVIWKLLVRDVVTLEDLEAVDALIVNSMRALRTIDATGVTAAQFADVIDETFMTLSTDNRTVALRPHGDTIPVKFENRSEFADAVEQFRLHEFDAAAACVRRGLGMVVPLRYLRLFTWRELESLVCGSPDVDIDLLQQCTEYSSCSASDQHVIWFWDVLRAYSHDARRAFLRFVWGRSRLPRTLPEFQAGQQFKLTAFDRRPADSYMPVSHTCFFSLELPRYSTHAILEARLTYAIYNCQAIDGDGDTMAANQLGWED